MSAPATSPSATTAQAGRRCTSCMLPSSYPTIRIDDRGQCGFCSEWKGRWENVDFERQSEALERILRSYRAKTRPYDCVIGLSGGKDSCYVALVAKQRGLRPLAVTLDNGFLSEEARSNIRHAVERLGVGHVMVKPDWGELQGYYRNSFVKAGEFCSACNVAIRAALYRVARAYGIRLIIAGTSPRTEANSPKEFFNSSEGYFDKVARGTFSQADASGFRFVSQAGRVARHLLGRPRYLQLPNYVPWREEEFLGELRERLGWGGELWEQHADCVMNEAKDYLKLKKFGVSERTAKLSALVRDGQLPRDRAIALAERYESGLLAREREIHDTIRARLSLSPGQLEEGLRASHLPYIPRMFGAFVALKKKFYR